MSTTIAQTDGQICFTGDRVILGWQGGVVVGGGY